MKKYNIINNSLGWLCFAISAVTYLLTIEPTASFWDCPEFISQGAKLEVGHPPGNPIFMLSARFFVTIFGNDMSMAAVAVNSMSALLSAGTILLLFWTITHLIRKLTVKDDASEISWIKTAVIMGGGLCGALAYTWSDTFWFSAVEGEVYAFSSFCTALVFWLILKWEDHADEPHSDRYLVLIAFVIGVSIAVHLLNLLCIPAIVLVFYYKKFKDANVKGSVLALVVSCIIVGVILYGLVPGFIKVAQGFELFCVNKLGMGFNVGVFLYAVIFIALILWTIYELYSQRSSLKIRIGFMLSVVLSGIPFISDSGMLWSVLILALAIYIACCRKIPVRIFNVITLSIFVIFIGYSSYALLLIRATANTPMNQNAPDNVFALASYLNREQYGERPLFYGTVFAEQLDLINISNDPNQPYYVVKVNERGLPETKDVDGYLYDSNGYMIDDGTYTYARKVKESPGEPDRYVKKAYTPHPVGNPDLNMLFTRIYSSDENHIKGYKSWCEYYNDDLESIPDRVAQSEPDVLRRWIEEGYAPYYELAPYITGQTEATIMVNEDNDPVYRENVWKADFGDNLRYFINYQLNHMYWRYFMWNFAGRQNDMQGNGEPHLGNWISGIPFIDNARLGDQSLLPDEFGKGNKGHNVFYMLPLLLGIFGLLFQAFYTRGSDPKRGIEQFWVVFFLFFMTGIAIVLYLNQTPGQPRERDYAFAGSFYAFAIWIGIGVPAIYHALNAAIRKLAGHKVSSGASAAPGHAGAGKNGIGQDRVSNAQKWATACLSIAIGLFVPLQMVSQTWDDHDRSHRYTTRDFGMNYLNSLDDNAIIFTNGDNDTFPLWYAQEVEGCRTDVRVVNLSYLSTDWYANQMLHPTYNAGAVEMTATPEDYAYNNLTSLCFALSNDTIGVIEGLEYFYATPANDVLRVLELENDMSYEVSAIRRYLSRENSDDIRMFYTPNLLARIDTTATYEAFGIDPESTDSIMRIPYLVDVMMSVDKLGQGFGLSKQLSYDITANSIAGGWKRPVYFATTVPDKYYLGLGDYMGLTGMASQVTPFYNAPVSPTVDKAYENIMSKFRWGGLDDPAHNKRLYLDETVRRMVSSTRLAIAEVAYNLIICGDIEASGWARDWAVKNGEPIPETRYDMARNLLNLMEEKLPADVAIYDNMIDLVIAQIYLRIYAGTENPDDVTRARSIIDSAEKRYAELMRYAASLSPSRFASLGGTSYALQYLVSFIALDNYAAVRQELAKNREENADLISGLDDIISYDEKRIGFPWEISYDFSQIAPYVYLHDVDAEELMEEYGGFDPTIQMILTILEAHDKAGIDHMERTNEIAKENGLSVEKIIRLTR